MTFERRILLLVAGLLALAVAVTAGALTWGVRDAAHGRARAEAEHAARHLAQSAHLIRTLPAEVDAAVTEQIVAQAALVAQYAASAEGAKLPVKPVTDRLKAVTDSTALKDIQVTDSRGKVVLGSAPNLDFTFTPDGKGAAFYGLLSRSPAQVVAPVAKREDGRTVKSVGVAGADKPRIVQVTADVGRVAEIGRRLGTLDRAVADALSGGAAAAWVLGGDAAVLARGGHAEAQLSPAELDAAKGARKPAVLTDGGVLTAVAPVEGGGAAVVRVALPGLPSTLWGGLAAGALAVVLGVWAVWLALHRQTAALATLTGAATAMENGRFNPFTLDPLRERPDEVGRLARAFRAMAASIDAREQGLEAELQLRAAKLEETAEKLKAEPSVAEP
ncbi:MAG TPA: HAMP domain-containing protein [Azospirillum sp.]|nr:HAMP domain-containing protein [Azospirillum sp.]